MYLRVVTGQVQPGKADDLAAHWQAYLATRVPDVPGFRHAYFTVDRATDTVVSVSVWDREPDQVRAERGLEDFVAQVAELIAGRPQAAVYEVLAEL
jgi:heme-degrading monooxygenase HmoA